MRTTTMSLLFAFLLPAAAFSADGDAVSFSKNKLLDAQGKEQKATMLLGADGATIHRKDHPEEVYSQFKYDNVTAIYYERAKSARIKTALLVSPVALFSKGKKHWLTVEYKDSDGKGDAVVLQMDKNEYRAILGELSSRCSVEIQRDETN